MIAQNSERPVLESNRRPGPTTNLALLAGFLMTGGLPPYPWTGILVPVAMALLFHALRKSERPGRTAWFFALAHQGSLLYWLFFLDPAKSIPTPILVPVQAILTVLYISVFYLLLGWVFGRIRRRFGTGRAVIALPALWTGLEAWRAVGEMGFPWCLSGSALIGTPLLPLVRAAGELGAGCGLAFLALMAVTWRRNTAVADRSFVASVIGSVVVWTFLAGGSFWNGAEADESTEISVAAIQADVALAGRWDKANIDSTRIPYEALTRDAAAGGAEFVVWAETAVPAYLRFDVELLNWIRHLVQETGVHLFTGFPDAERNPVGKLRRFNSAGLFGPEGMILDRYAKHHLLPIGETMPFQGLFPFLGKLDVGQAEWTPGDHPEPMSAVTGTGTLVFSGLVCFESAFASLATESVRRGSRCLVVITNDGWFGNTGGPRQHAALSTLRAAECGVPLIRCANNGISFICDDRGKILDSLELGRRGWIAASIVPGPGDTLFVRSGNWPLGIFLLAWLAAALFLPWLSDREET